jgi:hypothetical protein
MATKHKPFSLAFDAETTRPGERTFAEPDPTDAISAAFARRLRDVERAGHLRNALVSAEVGALECARFCRHTQHDRAAAARHERAADFYRALYWKVVGLQARARGEASDGE